MIVEMNPMSKEFKCTINYFVLSHILSHCCYLTITRVEITTCRFLEVSMSTLKSRQLKATVGAYNDIWLCSQKKYQKDALSIL